jgi:hypothetical protein
VTNDSVGTFDILGIVDEDFIRSTFWGYAARVRIDGFDDSIQPSGPLTFFGVHFAVSWRYISSNAAILFISAHNSNDTRQTVDIGITTDINFEGNDAAPCAAIPGRRGFSVISPYNVLTFVTNGYPFVTNASTFWFGYFFNLTLEGWTQTTAVEFSGIDSAAAWTWQGIVLEPGQAVVKSTLVRFGPFETSQIVLKMSLPRPSVVYCHSPISIGGIASVFGIPTLPTMRIFVVINDDVKTMEEIPGRFVVSDKFTIVFVPAQYGLTNGSYNIAFYAVDADGDVSAPESVNLTVTDVAPTPTEDTTDSSAVSGVTAIIAAVGVIGGVALATGIVFAIRYKRRRWIHKVDEKLDDGSSVPTEDATRFDKELMAN